LAYSFSSFTIHTFGPFKTKELTDALKVDYKAAQTKVGYTEELTIKVHMTFVAEPHMADIIEESDLVNLD